MDKFVDTYSPLKLNQEDLNNLNRSVTSDEIEAIIVSQQKKSSGLDGFTAKFYQNFKEVIPTLLNFSMKYEGKEHCQIHSYEASIRLSPN
jgi:hypothetical protein